MNLLDELILIILTSCLAVTTKIPLPQENYLGSALHVYIYILYYIYTYIHIYIYICVYFKKCRDLGPMLN